MSIDKLKKYEVDYNRLNSLFTAQGTNLSQAGRAAIFRLADQVEAGIIEIPNGVIRERRGLQETVMEVRLGPKAEKYLARQNEPLKSRIIQALEKLEKEPPQGDIKRLEGQDGYRARIGGYRILFDIENNKIDVFKISPRGDAYKEN